MHFVKLLIHITDLPRVIPGRSRHTRIKPSTRNIDAVSGSALEIRNPSSICDISASLSSALCVDILICANRFKIKDTSAVKTKAYTLHHASQIY